MSRHLSRRQFLAGAGVAAASAAGAAAIAQHPWAASGTPRRPTTAAASSNGILVLVTLYGGNDGLNTVIPYADPAYPAARATLGYPPDQVIPLAEGLGLHPNLKGLKALWDAKQLAVVLGVGYPNPVRSHFRSMDIWQSASPDSPVATGWLGRWLDTGTDPMRALSIGTTLPLVLTGAKQSGTAVSGTGVTLAGGPRVTSSLAGLWSPGSDRSGLAARVAGSGADLLSVQHTLADLLGASAPPAGGSSHFELAPPSSGVATTTTIPAPTTPAPTTPAPTTKGAGTAAPGHQAAANSLATELQFVARLIKAGAPTRVYQVSLGGFDNHAAEKDIHARLMGQLDEAVAGFFSSLRGDRHSAGVTLLTYSEFGRRVGQNASGGTDHGTAAPLFVVGPSVRGGRFYGAPPSLTDLDHGDLKFTTDFRSVYASVLGPVIGVGENPALLTPFPSLGFV